MFELDEAEKVLLPWDCKIRYAGVIRATMPPTVGQLLSLEKLSESKSASSNTQTLKLVADLFEGGEADVADIPLTSMLLVIEHVFDYFKGYAAKNSLAVAKAAAATVANGSAAGE